MRFIRTATVSVIWLTPPSRDPLSSAFYRQNELRSEASALYTYVCPESVLLFAQLPTTDFQGAAQHLQFTYTKTTKQDDK